MLTERDREELLEIAQDHPSAYRALMEIDRLTELLNSSVHGSVDKETPEGGKKIHLLRDDMAASG